MSLGRDESLTRLHSSVVDRLICTGFASSGAQHSQENRGLQKGRGSQEEAPRVKTASPRCKTEHLDLANIYFLLLVFSPPAFKLFVKCSRVSVVPGTILIKLHVQEL